MTHPLDTIAPTPDPDTATCQDIAGWFAANALFLLGRADRIQEENRAATSDTYLDICEGAASQASIARALYGAAVSTAPDQTARAVLTAALTGDSMSEAAGAIASWAGHDPNAVRSAGYES